MMNSVEPHADHGNAVLNLEEPRANSYVVVTQVKSFRVIYFTTDENYALPPEEDWCFASSYQGELPAGMTLQNCWAWRFNGNAFVYAGDATVKDGRESLLNANRKALHRILNEKIHRIRKPYQPSDAYGYEVRARKLKEAQAFIDGKEDASYDFLQATAQARNISVSDAASLVVERAKQEKQMLVSTERVRERMALLIDQADSDERLLGLRSFVLEDVYPELSREFKYRPIDTTPVNADAPLPRHAVVQERARLTAGLREAINQIRQDGHPYAYDDHVWQHKAKIAAQYLQAGDSAAANKVSPLLESASRATGMSVQEVAQLWLSQLGLWSRKLIETELAGRDIESRIGRAVSSDDFSAIERMVRAMFESHRTDGDSTRANVDTTKS